MPYRSSATRKIARSRRRSLAAHLFKLTYVVLQLLVVHLSVELAFLIYYHWIYETTRLTIEISREHYFSILPFMLAAALIYIDYFGMTHFFRKSSADIASAAVKFTFLLMITTSAVAFFGNWSAFSRYVLIIAGIILLLFTFILLKLSMRISNLIYKRGRLLIVAASADDAERLFSKVCPELRQLHLLYLGYVLQDNPEVVRDAIRYSSEVMISSEVSETEKSKLLLYCAERDKTVYIVPQFTDLIYTRFRVIQFTDMPSFLIDTPGLTFQQRALKRLFDFVFSLLMLVLTLPLQLIIALAIRIDSPGSIFYMQERYTIGGRIYRVLKFRTMVEGAEAKFGAFQSDPHDPRVTRVGRFLRNTHLDELPQFINILLGDMSVVGPRSDRPITIGAFEGQIPGYNQRLKVKAGLTGMAQIYGKYDSSAENKLRYDLMYIKNYSLLLDLQIIVRTIRQVWPSPNELHNGVTTVRNYEFRPPRR